MSPAWGATPRPAFDLDAPVSLARMLRFDGADPRHFGAPPPRRQPLRLPGFAGAVQAGASCNCATLEFVPHCHGTHTESVAHLVSETLDACEVAPLGLLPALLIDVVPVAARDSAEDSDPPPEPDDLLVTRTALLTRWPASLPFQPRALVLRTTSGEAVAPRHLAPAAGRGAPAATATAGEPSTPYLSRQCAVELVARGIEHLVVDLPSIDRGHDLGRLCAHRIFFGLPPGSTRLADAARPHCTVTEFAMIPPDVDAGACALQLTRPRIAGDAVPSQPLLYRLAAA